MPTTAQIGPGQETGTELRPPMWVVETEQSESSLLCRCTSAQAGTERAAGMWPHSDSGSGHLSHQVKGCPSVIFEDKV